MPKPDAIPANSPVRDLDIEAYFDRIGYDGPGEPTLPVLKALHLAHATHIPFENLDVLLGRPIRLDLENIQRKLVATKRGGYCFEHNILFSHVLEALGFKLVRLAARVRYRTTAVLPRTHMLLAVDIAGSPWLADVGFGGEGLFFPVPIDNETESTQFLWHYRVVKSPAGHVLQSRRAGSWNDLYVFTREPQELVDYELANHYVSTHPGSRFTQTLTAQTVSPEARYFLRNLELTEDRGADISSRLLANDAELLDVLREVFGLNFPPETRFAFQRP